MAIYAPTEETAEVSVGKVEIKLPTWILLLGALGAGSILIYFLLKKKR